MNDKTYLPDKDMEAYGDFELKPGEYYISVKTH